MEQIFLFLFRSCLRGNDRCVEYYDRLGVTKNATREEIRRAYRLKSLALHPDKLTQKGQVVTPEIQAQFTSIKEAYEVLSDNKKRKTYDMVGESGLKIMSAQAGGDPMIIARNLKSAPCMDKLLLITIILMIAAFPIVQPVLFCLKVDDDIDSSWKAIWTPMWILDILQLILVVAILSEEPGRGHKYSQPNNAEDNAEGTEEHEREPMSQIEITTSVVDAIMFPICQIMIILRLDGDVDYSWGVIFIALYIWLVNGMIASYHPFTVNKYKPTASTSTEGMSEEEAAIVQQKEVEEYMEFMRIQIERVNATHSIIVTILQIIFVALLSHKLDDGGITWAAVFSPLWIYFGYFVLRYFYVRSLAQTVEATFSEQDIISHLNENGEINLPPELQYRVAYSQALRNDAGGSILMFCFVVIIGSLTYVKVKGADDYSTFIIFIPVFIIAGIFFCIICCLTCVGTVSLARTPTDDLNQYSQFNSASSQEAGHADAGTGNGSSPHVGYSTFQQSGADSAAAIEVVRKESPPKNDNMAID